MNQHTYLTSIAEHPWAISESGWRTVLTQLAGRIVGAPQEPGEVRPPMLRRQLPAGVAVIPIHGVIAPRASMWDELFGGTSYQTLKLALRLAVADPAVKAIVLDVYSPGGSVAGATEFARALREARQIKPIIAVAEYAMCSAAYWICANASEIVAAPSSHVGSVGVYTVHEDLSKMLEQLGVKPSIISAGRFKVDANPFEPLTDAARARIQRQVDAAFNTFVNDVARGRGVTPAAVKSGFGEGAVVDSADALRLGMVNRIGTLEDTVTSVLSTPSTTPITTPARPPLPAAARANIDACRAQLAQATGVRLH